METTVNATNYVTTFHVGQDSEGNWKAWTEFNGKVIKERYCLSENHAKRTRKYLVNKFWGFKLN